MDDVSVNIYTGGSSRCSKKNKRLQEGRRRSGLFLGIFDFDEFRNVYMYTVYRTSKKLNVQSFVPKSDTYFFI